MRTVERFSRNIAWQAMAEALTRLIAFLYTAFIARALGVTEFGIYTIILIFARFGITATDFGFIPLIVRDVAKEKRRSGEYLGNALLLQLMIFVPVFVLLALTANFLGYESRVKHLIYIYSVGVLCISLAGTFGAVFKAHERFKYPAMISVAAMVARAGLYFGAVILGYGLGGIAGMFVVAALLQLGLMAGYALRRIGNLRISVQRSSWRYLLSEGLAFALIGVVGIIYFRADTVILSRLQGESATGLYGASFRIFDLLLVIPSLVSGTIYPVMSRFHAMAADLNRIIYEKYFQYMLFLGLPMALGVTFLSKEIMALVFGEAFIPSAHALSVLTWTLFLIFLNSPPGALLNSTGRQWSVLGLTIVAALLNIVLDFLLIPSYSLNGAAYATVLPRIIVFLSFQFLVSKYYFRIRLGQYTPKLIVASAIMAGFIYLGRGLNLIIVVLGAITLYFFMLYLLGTFDEFDKMLARRAFSALL